MQAAQIFFLVEVKNLLDGEIQQTVVSHLVREKQATGLLLDDHLMHNLCLKACFDAEGFYIIEGGTWGNRDNLSSKILSFQILPLR